MFANLSSQRSPCQKVVKYSIPVFTGPDEHTLLGRRYRVHALPILPCRESSVSAAAMFPWSLVFTPLRAPSLARYAAFHHQPRPEPVLAGTTTLGNAIRPTLVRTNGKQGACLGLECFRAWLYRVPYSFYLPKKLAGCCRLPNPLAGRGTVSLPACAG